MTDNLAIITSGGGLRCSFGVGVMLALAEQFGIDKPSYLISCSGSAGTGSYFVSKQYESIRNIWSNLLSTKQFVRISRFWKMIDIDYLIDTVFKKQAQLDLETFHSSPIHYLIPALNRQTGEVNYFSNRDEQIDIYEVMRATKAMPIAFKLNPKVNINDSTYCDSCLSSSAENHLEKAIELGAEKVLMVNNSVKSSSDDFEDKFFRLWVSAQTKYFRRNYAQAELKARDYLSPREIELFNIRPKEPLAVSTLNNNQESLIATIRQGYQETSSNRELADFLR
ncbi:MAG: patatin-like phospholipase family protein [archaeon]|nr:patatin-like phospholipase family protein [archaeon]